MSQRKYPSKWWACRTVRGLRTMLADPGYHWMRADIHTELLRRMPNFKDPVIHTPNQRKARV